MAPKNRHRRTMRRAVCWAARPFRGGTPRDYTGGRMVVTAALQSMRAAADLWTPAPGRAAGQVRAAGAPARDPAVLDGGLPPHVQPIADLYLACRLDGEHYAECFARLGARGYAALLDEALAAPTGARPSRTELAHGPGTSVRVEVRSGRRATCDPISPRR